MNRKSLVTCLAGALCAWAAASASALIVAIYAIFETIGNYVPALGLETHGGLVVAYLGGVATHVWTIRGYFETIPVEIEIGRASGRERV